MTLATVCPDAKRGTVAAVVVVRAPDPETEPNPGVTVVAGERTHRCERGGRGECHVSINVVHMVVKRNVFISDFNVKLKPALREWGYYCIERECSTCYSMQCII